ncbi:hypothetical protein HAINFHK1212_1602 [Haemophilus influenzae HK1212]|uniref:Uncharacterized protein n=1 Tax=Haemophilus influenzae HK1212 TaxID=456482 RepID=A0A7G2JY81_HAEIF|nr:hypothetical protein HAINFHK1212_1602 [Haemophilus influenzae HK1212]
MAVADIPLPLLGFTIKSAKPEHLALSWYILFSLYG